LTKIHELEAPSFSFLRILRYPPTAEGVGEGTLRERPRVQAHRDVVSIAMLLTWVSGLQIPVENAEMIDPLTPTEESWHWVRPEAGQLIVNLGDSMPVLTNGVLKSGLHRVVTPHGEQSSLDRVSVLFTGRPNWEAPMIPFISSKIPSQTAEQKAKPIELCKAWGDDRIKALYVDNISTGKIR
jgi:isopenicillin N synthase-like dioxygenase